MNRRATGLPVALRQALADSRRKHGWTQAEVGERVGLPQMHISGIETGRVVPRYDTLLDLIRVLDYDLILVPRDLVPVMQSLIRAHRNQQAHGVESTEEQPLYALDDEE